CDVIKLPKKDEEIEIEKADYLPQFGSPELQLKFAMGAADVAMSDDEAAKIFKSEHVGSVEEARKYFEGMLYTTSGNNLLTFFYNYLESMPIKDEEKDLEKIQKIRNTNERKKKVFIEMMIPSK
ncbi:hypothetical protein PMAYCL1PPCAC_04133, partial [Pristionchus mayeri]